MLVFKPNETINLKNTFYPSLGTHRKAYLHPRNHRNEVFTKDLRSFLQIETVQRHEWVTKWVRRFEHCTFVERRSWRMCCVWSNEKYNWSSVYFMENWNVNFEFWKRRYKWREGREGVKFLNWISLGTFKGSNIEVYPLLFFRGWWWVCGGVPWNFKIRLFVKFKFNNLNDLVNCY